MSAGSMSTSSRIILRLSVLAVMLAVATGTRSASAVAGHATLAGALDAPFADLARATIVTPATQTVPERTAVRVLVEEIEKRTAIRLPVSTTWPSDAIPVIAVGPLATAATWAGPGMGAPSS